MASCLSSILSGFAESRTTLSVETYFANPQAVAAGDLRIDEHIAVAWCSKTPPLLFQRQRFPVCSPETDCGREEIPSNGHPPSRAAFA